jgi:signal transduction histidine kinase
MTTLKPFELPSFYRFLMQYEDRKWLIPITRLTWFTIITFTLYVETHRGVTVYTLQQLQLGWQLVFGWAVLSGVLTLIMIQASDKHEKKFSLNLTVLLCVDGLFLGCLVGVTGLTYSVFLFPAILFTMILIFFGHWKQWAPAFGVLGVSSVVTHSYFSLFNETLTSRDYVWAAAGVIIIGLLSTFMVSNLRRHGMQVVRDRMYQKWLEQLNTIIFELMPAGAVVCDGVGRIRRANPVIEPYVRSLMSRQGSILELRSEWQDKSEVAQLISDEPTVRLSSSAEPDGRLFRVVFKPLTLQDPPQDALFLLLMYDVTEIERRQREEEISRRWSSFQNITAGLVHEIRNPLGAILGVIETVLDSDELSKNDKVKMLSMVRYEGERMNSLVQDFLDSMQTNLVLNVEKHDIKKICEDFYQLASKDPRVKSESVAFTFRNNLKGSTLLEVDKDRLLQVLHNLFQNAAHAVITQGDPQAGVVLEIENDGTQGVIIRFLDYGGGISPEIMHRMMDPFFTTKEKGTGLGLSITYRIIEAHNGKLRHVSQKGRPTRAEVWLPY